MKRTLTKRFTCQYYISLNREFFRDVRNCKDLYGNKSSYAPVAFNTNPCYFESFQAGLRTLPFGLRA